MLHLLRQCRVPFPQPRRLFHDVRTYKEDIRWQGWQVVIGIETHAQIKSRQKLFSGKPLGQSKATVPWIHLSDRIIDLGAW